MTSQPTQPLSAAVSKNSRGDGALLECAACRTLELRGRKGTTDPIHCRDCHTSWTGNEAQHCVVAGCHKTFTNITQAEAHRYHKDAAGHVRDRCCDPNRTKGWREVRPGVWTSAVEMTAEMRSGIAA